MVARLTESDWHDQPDLSYLSIEESSRKAKYLFKKGIRKSHRYAAASAVAIPVSQPLQIVKDEIIEGILYVHRGVRGICRIGASSSNLGPRVLASSVLSSRKPRKSPGSFLPVPGCFPPGSDVPTSDTKLTLDAVQSAAVMGKLVCEKGVRYDNNPGIGGATITFTGSMPHSLTAETDSNGDYLAGHGYAGTFHISHTRSQWFSSRSLGGVSDNIQYGAINPTWRTSPSSSPNAKFISGPCRSTK
jgi:hypothetical protein